VKPFNTGKRVLNSEEVEDRLSNAVSFGKQARMVAQENLGSRKLARMQGVPKLIPFWPNVAHVKAPNDPKLSDCGGRRSLCGKAAGGERSEAAGAQAVTPGAVRGMKGGKVNIAGREESGKNCLLQP